MPCQSFSPEEELSQAYGDVEKLTQICCDFGKVIRKHNLVRELSNRAHRWLRKHERLDRSRRKAEKEQQKKKHQRSIAMAKLTPEEIKVLGLEK